MDIYNFLQVSATALTAIFVWTFLYKENRLYRFIEYTVIAATAGSLTVMSYESVVRIGMTPIQSGNYAFIIPFILGALLYTRFWKKTEWLQRYPTAIMIAVFTGLTVRGIVGTEIIKQIQSTVSISFFNINNIILVVGVITAIYYFVFTSKLSLPKTLDSPLKRIGRFFIMATFGFYVGNTFMSRIVTVIDRLQFILFEWIKALL